MTYLSSRVNISLTITFAIMIQYCTRVCGKVNNCVWGYRQSQQGVIIITSVCSQWRCVFSNLRSVEEKSPCRRTTSRCAPTCATHPALQPSEPSGLLRQYYTAAHACPHRAPRRATPRHPRNQRFPSVVMSVDSGRIRLWGRLIRKESRGVGVEWWGDTGIQCGKFWK